MSRFGILTGGGDAPGLNAVIRAVVRRSIPRGHTVVGIRRGWKGLLDKDTVPLDLAAISGILHRGGTILGTSRTNPYKKPEDAERLRTSFRALGLDALIACGGEDTLGVANRLASEGFPVVGVPKTIDNDLSGTDFTFGFDTAVAIATEAIDRLHTTAESHDRVIVVEVMGRHAGWIATWSGMAGGADVILVPEVPVRMAMVLEAIEKRRARGKNFAIVVAAEGAVLAGDETGVEGGAGAHDPGNAGGQGRARGSVGDAGGRGGSSGAGDAGDASGSAGTSGAGSVGGSGDPGGLVTKNAATDAFGHVTLGGIGETLASRIKERTGLDTRVVVLGHVQRGGTPTARDRVLGTLFGVAAADLADRGEFGKMAALRGEHVIAVPIAEGVASLKTVDPELYRIAQTFFG